MREQPYISLKSGDIASTSMRPVIFSWLKCLSRVISLEARWMWKIWRGRTSTQKKTSEPVTVPHPDDSGMIPYTNGIQYLEGVVPEQGSHLIFRCGPTWLSFKLRKRMWVCSFCDGGLKCDRSAMGESVPPVLEAQQPGLLTGGFRRIWNTVPVKLVRLVSHSLQYANLKTVLQTAYFWPMRSSLGMNT